MTSKTKGAVVVNAYWRGGDDGAKNIARALQELGAEVSLLRASEIDLGVGEGLTGSFPYDFVVFLDKDDHLARLLEKSGVRLFNSAESGKLSSILGKIDFPPESAEALFDNDGVAEFLFHVV